MPSIRLLTEEIIGKIAAGEVVERPAAAIKELVENSLDAGASAVTVEIRDGGISYFRVSDNGMGIHQADIRMAFERHATSKISRSSDLNAIATLGFRGEALASIAAVARVTCTTRTKDDATGIRVQNEGGTITSIEEAACPEGTTFVVKDLFYNTPVRLKFLKKAVTEAGFVSDLMMRLILSRPDVSFRYISQGKTLYHSAGDGKLESAVFAIYGNELLRNMRQIDGHEAGMVIKGYVGIGESGRSNRSHESFFINGRYMRSAILSAAVESACRERVMIGKYPTCVLHITMPYESVDVNVHPNKLEVRFQNEQAVGEAVMRVVMAGIAERDALERPTPLLLTPDDQPKNTAQVTLKQEGAPTLEVSPKKTAPTERTEAPVLTMPEPKAAIPSAAKVPQAPTPQLTVSRTVPAESVTPTLREPSADISRWTETATAKEAEAPKLAASEAVKANEQQPLPKPEAPKPVQAEQVKSFLPEQPKPMKMIGTVFNTYILVEYEDHLLMIDQHAVHERLLFDRWMKLYDTQRAGQELLVPLVMSVTRREQMLLAENRELLERIGLVTELFGDSEISIRTVPMLLGEPQTEDFLRDVLAELENERGSVTLEKRRAAILQTACKHAVKGGEKLTDDDLRDLVSKMIDQRVTPTCPHGRPLVVSLSHGELDKKFRRIQ